MTKINPFHLAIPVDNLEKCRKFYRDVLRCKEGRSSEDWVDLDLFGHQLVLHVSEKAGESAGANPVDGHSVPIPHFGVVLDWDQWEDLAETLKQHQVKFMIEPYVRFKGQPGEQATLFFQDPAGNALEFKSFRDMGQLFAS